MTRLKEYLCVLAILLVNVSLSFVCWNYSAPGHLPLPRDPFSAEAVAAQPDAPATTNQNTAQKPLQNGAPNTIPNAAPVAAQAEPVAVPILMYHKVNPSPRAGGLLYRVMPEDFEWQMQYLKENGYHTVDLGAVLDQFQKGTRLPDKPIVLTFDDGYRDNYEYAYPILKKYGFTATIFVVTNTVSPPEVHNMLLTWDQIREMANNGITIGCHTLDHEQLTRVSWEEAWRQIADSKNVLEEQLGKKVQFFCYPYGSFNHSIVEIVKDCGFRGAVNVNPEWVTSADNPYSLNRMGISGKLDQQGFIDMVSQ